MHFYSVSMVGNQCFFNYNRHSYRHGWIIPGNTAPDRFLLFVLWACINSLHFFKVIQFIMIKIILMIIPFPSIIVFIFEFGLNLGAVMVKNLPTISYHQPSSCGRCFGNSCFCCMDIYLACHPFGCLCFVPVGSDCCDFWVDLLLFGFLLLLH